MAGFVPTLLLTQIDGLMLGVILAAITTANMHEYGRDGGRYTALIFVGALTVAAVAFVPYLVQGYRQTPGPAELFSFPQQEETCAGGLMRFLLRKAVTAGE